MKAFLICPFHRPNDLDNLLSNYKRQIYPDKTLIIIRNGNASNTKIPEDKNIIVLNSQPHQSHAKNAGIDYVDINYKTKDKCWITWDADDTYYPGYVSEAVWLLGINSPNVIVGKRSHIVKTQTMETFLYRHPYPDFIHGATISTMDFTKRFTDFNPFGEDFTFVNTFPVENRIVSSIWHYCYNRNNYGRDHTWQGTDYQIQEQNQIPKCVSDYYLQFGNSLIGPYVQI